ncbi:MAG: sensor histidine kinase KdpD [Rhizobiales bacterium]|nr:sensor histidine kinase KdpD [Hyphomicrobiales bacterium]
MAATGEARPSAEALLALAKQERRGRLKVFLGASPGVGKTYAMLSQAQRLKAEGKDVLVGVVETHGRAETAELLEGLEVLPRKTISYRGHTLMEFDIDAALARRPALIIVDELAHSNAPDSRHPKRYQDVEELLDAGIDVWTALNIQHLESLSDVVSSLTGVTVRELVPDTVIEKADDVVVVDITPGELIQRLKEGKVYLPDNARRAADNFLKAGNLTALRELALRRTADRVDDQMVSYLRQNAIEGPWPTAERILVCVGPDPNTQAVVRAAGRLANGLNGSWVALNVQRLGEDVDDATAKRIDDALNLARRLGADTARLAARDLPDEMLRYARRENITQIVMGRSRAGWLRRLMGRSLSEEVTRLACGIAVHVITPEEDEAPRWHWQKLMAPIRAAGLIAAPVSVGVAILIGKLALHWLNRPSLSMIFLLAVLLCAVNFGMRSAVLAAFLSFLAYNFFFIEPIHTFTVASPHELLALVIFLVVAVVTGGLAGRIRERSDAAQRRIRQTQMLFDFSRKLSGTAGLDDVLWAVASQTAGAVKGQSIVLLANGDDLAIRAAFPPEDTMGPSEWAAARWAMSHGEVAGLGSTTLPNAQYRFSPLRTSRGTVGVIGVKPGEETLTDDDHRMLDSLFDQTAIAIERVLLVRDANEAQAAAESERLRSALLSSLSHDLRTPLASILGAVTSLRSLGERMPKDARDDLLVAIEEEAVRLSNFVANLLDMTRLESGALDLMRDWIDLGDTVRAAAARAKKLWPDRPVALSIAPDVPLVRGDSGLLEQVIFNLIDNANKYAPAGEPVDIAVAAERGTAVLTVTDKGQGIPQQDLERIFTKFYRGVEGDGRRAGTGLGLAIARGVVDAMGGKIKAESPVAEGRGARLRIVLPAAAPKEALEG